MITQDDIANITNPQARRLLEAIKNPGSASSPIMPSSGTAGRVDAQTGG